MPTPDHLGTILMIRVGILYRNIPYCSLSCSLQRLVNMLSIVSGGDAFDIQYTILRVRQTRNLSSYCISPNI